MMGAKLDIYCSSGNSIGSAIEFTEPLFGSSPETSITLKYFNEYSIDISYPNISHYNSTTNSPNHFYRLTDKNVIEHFFHQRKIKITKKGKKDKEIILEGT
jgi:hypothetical protein